MSLHIGSKRRMSGKMWELVAIERLKKDAQREADRRRNKGYRTRVVQIKGGWGLYGRRFF